MNIENKDNTITFEQFEKLPWDWWEDGISSNPNLTLEWIEKYEDKNWNWGYNGISSNPNLTLEWIEKYEDKGWDWEEISNHPNLTLEWLEKYPNKDWDWRWSGISSNPNVTLECLEKYPNKDWDWRWSGISSNPNLTPEWLEKYPNKPWDWGEDGISSNPNLTLEWLEKYPNKPWDWGEDGISSNPNLTLEWLEKYPDTVERSWDWGEDGISSNPNVTFEWLEKYPDKGWCKELIKRIENNHKPIDIQMIKRSILEHTNIHNNFFIVCLEISKKYKPSKNEYKFSFGGLIQSKLISLLDNVFYKCDDLDKKHTHGAEYKVDCCLSISESQKFNISIKAKLNKTGSIILINKNSNGKTYNLSNLITVVVIIETRDILIISHNDVDDKYIQNNQANIKYRSSLITHIYKTKPECIISLQKNEKYDNFIKNDYDNIKLIDINNLLNSTLKNTL